MDPPERAASVRGNDGGAASSSDHHAALNRAGTRASSTRAVAAADSLRRKGSEWEILGSLEQGVAYGITPKKQEGYMAKRRKWPLKGWHKR